MPQKEIITKLQAAQRQLIVATQLFFHDSDVVSIHTLAAASYNILRDLSKHYGVSGMTLKDDFVKNPVPRAQGVKNKGAYPVARPQGVQQFLTTISKANQKKVADWANSFENFFKHADRDPDGIIELNPDLTELMLIDAWAQYEKFNGDLPCVGKAFKIWSFKIGVGKFKDHAPEEIKALASQYISLNKLELYAALCG